MEENIKKNSEVEKTEKSKKASTSKESKQADVGVPKQLEKVSEKRKASSLTDKKKAEEISPEKKALSPTETPVVANAKLKEPKDKRTRESISTGIEPIATEKTRAKKASAKKVISPEKQVLESSEGQTSSAPAKKSESVKVIQTRNLHN